MTSSGCRAAGARAGRWSSTRAPATSTRAPRPLVLTEDRQVRRLSLTDFPTPPAVAGPDEDRQALQSQGARRPGATWPPRSGPSWPRSTSARRGTGEPGVDRRTGRPDRGAAGPSCAGTPATTAPTGRPTPGGPNGRCGWSGRTPGCRRGSPPGPTRSPTTSTRSAWCWSRSAT